MISGDRVNRYAEDVRGNLIWALVYAWHQLISRERAAMSDSNLPETKEEELSLAEKSNLYSLNLSLMSTNDLK